MGRSDQKKKGGKKKKNLIKKFLFSFSSNSIINKSINKGYTKFINLIKFFPVINGPPTYATEVINTTISDVIKNNSLFILLSIKIFF